MPFCFGEYYDLVGKEASNATDSHPNLECSPPPAPCPCVSKGFRAAVVKLIVVSSYSLKYGPNIQSYQCVCIAYYYGLGNNFRKNSWMKIVPYDFA
jgi:hypothetical protein